MSSHVKKIIQQFSHRASTFEKSAHWITSPDLVRAHVKLAGPVKGKALEMCCGTGVIGTALADAGWDVTGVDITPLMLAQASSKLRLIQSNVESIPLPDASFDLIVMRQAFFLLENGQKVIHEAKRLLRPGGSMIFTQLVPFAEEDSPHLEKIHTVKQEQMTSFFTHGSFEQELTRGGLEVVKAERVVVRESVSLWMREAPDLSEEIRGKVCDLVIQAPKEYREIHRTSKDHGEITEDWNWSLLQVCAKA